RSTPVWYLTRTCRSLKSGTTAKPRWRRSRPSSPWDTTSAKPERIENRWRNEALEQPCVVFLDAFDRQPVEEVGVAHPGTQRVKVGELRRHEARRHHQALVHEMGQRFDVAQRRLATKQERQPAQLAAADRQADVVVDQHKPLAVTQVLGKRPGP